MIEIKLYGKSMMKNYCTLKQQKEQPSLRLNINFDSLSSKKSSTSSSSFSPFNFDDSRLFPLRKKIYIGKIKRKHNNNNIDYDDDDDDSEHFNWIDYGNMKPKQIEAIKSFCCNQSILLVSSVNMKMGYSNRLCFFSFQRYCH